jgi:hypothetical protein
MAILGGLCVATASLQAAEGVLIMQRTTTSGGSQKTSQVQIEKNRMRTEMTDANGAKTAVVFDGTKQVMYMINLDRKTYTEMTKADADRLGGMAQGAMAQMQAKMASLPPEQRAKVEAMMKSTGTAMGMGTSARTEYRKTGTDKVGKWTCDKYEGYRNGEKATEICTVDPSALGFTAADFAVTTQFVEFFKAMIPQGADELFGLGKPEDKGFSGLPIRTVTTVMGRQTTSELIDASRQSFPDAVFAVPEGFQKQDVTAGRGRGRQ